MSDALTDDFENRTLNFLLTASSVTRPTAWYVGLYATGNQPSDSSAGTELSGSGYARESVSFSVSSNVAQNSSTITFNTQISDATSTDDLETVISTEQLKFIYKF